MKTFKVTMRERGKDGKIRTIKQTAVCETPEQVVAIYGLDEPDILEYKIDEEVQS